MYNNIHPKKFEDIKSVIHACYSEDSWCIIHRTIMGKGFS